jgi:hypothetical protein
MAKNNVAPGRQRWHVVVESALDAEQQPDFWKAFLELCKTWRIEVDKIERTAANDHQGGGY